MKKNKGKKKTVGPYEFDQYQAYKNEQSERRRRARHDKKRQVDELKRDPEEFFEEDWDNFEKFRR